MKEILQSPCSEWCSQVLQVDSSLVTGSYCVAGTQSDSGSRRWKRREDSNLLSILWQAVSQCLSASLAWKRINVSWLKQSHCALLWSACRNLSSWKAEAPLTWGRFSFLVLLGCWIPGCVTGTGGLFIGFSFFFLSFLSLSSLPFLFVFFFFFPPFLWIFLVETEDSLCRMNREVTLCSYAVIWTGLIMLLVSYWAGRGWGNLLTLGWVFKALLYLNSSLLSFYWKDFVLNDWKVILLGVSKWQLQLRNKLF